MALDGKTLMQGKADVVRIGKISGHGVHLTVYACFLHANMTCMMYLFLICIMYLVADMHLFCMFHPPRAGVPEAKASIF